MAGLDYGHKFNMSTTYRKDNKSDNEFNSEGVFHNQVQNKWVVRMKNKTKSKHIRPFVSVAQFTTKEAAQKHFDNLMEDK